jgi:hypothetical protein
MMVPFGDSIGNPPCLVDVGDQIAIVVQTLGVGVPAPPVLMVPYGEKLLKSVMGGSAPLGILVVVVRQSIHAISQSPRDNVGLRVRVAIVDPIAIILMLVRS